MNSHALSFGRHRLRDAGLRTPDSIATSEMAEQTGVSIGGLGVILAGVVGLLVLAVL